MLYSCTHTATVSVKRLRLRLWTHRTCVTWLYNEPFLPSFRRSDIATGKACQISLLSCPLPIVHLCTEICCCNWLVMLWKLKMLCARIIRLSIIIISYCIIRLLRVDLIKLVSIYVCPSVRPQKFFRFERYLVCIIRGRWVLQDGMPMTRSKIKVTKVWNVWKWSISKVILSANMHVIRRLMVHYDTPGSCLNFNRIDFWYTSLFGIMWPSNLGFWNGQETHRWPSSWINSPLAL